MITVAMEMNRDSVTACLLKNWSNDQPLRRCARSGTAWCESLYAALFVHKIEEMVAFVEAKTALATDPLDGLRRAVRAQFEFHDANRAFFDLFVRQRLHGSPGADDPWEDVVTHYRRHFKVLVDLIELAQKEKLLRKTESHLLASALLGFIIQIARGAQREGNSEPLVKHTALVCDLFLNGAKA